jgi:hypothetical protein
MSYGHALASVRAFDDHNPEACEFCALHVPWSMQAAGAGSSNR